MNGRWPSIDKHSEQYAKRTAGRRQGCRRGSCGDASRKRETCFRLGRTNQGVEEVEILNSRTQALVALVS
jgi:hypothetical protein